MICIIRKSRLNILLMLSGSFQCLEKEVKKQEKTAGKLADSRTKMQQKVTGIKQQVEALGFSESEFTTLEQEKNQLETQLSDLGNMIDQLTTKIESRLRFEYSDPVRGFDRSKVKGLVAKLIQVRDPKHTAALEIVAGGKLYQVVVDEAITGKALLERGKLQKRVTIIPLDKISAKPLDHAVTRKATSIASASKAAAVPAIELVGFDEEVRNAMEYVFGKALVVDNAKAANQICDETKTRTVTLDGDVYDPSGTISGGSKNMQDSILDGIAQLANASAQYSVKQQALKIVSDKLEGMKGKSIEYDNLSTAVELAEAELAGVEKHLSQTSYGVVLERKEAMSKELQQAEDEYIRMEKEKEEKWDLYHELKNREAELTQQREFRLKEIEEAVKAAKLDVTEKVKAAREAESKSQTLIMELESLKAELSAAQEAVRIAEKALHEANMEESDLQMRVGEMKAIYDEAKEGLEKTEKRMATCSTELNDLNRKRAKRIKATEAAAVEVKKLQVSISKIQKERANAEKVVSSMLKKYSWIESEQSAFGVDGGDYDFKANDPKETSKQLQGLKGEQDWLVSHFNVFLQRKILC